jgi:hypothetical protein
MAKLKGINCKLYDGDTLLPTTDWSLEEGMDLEDTTVQGDASTAWTAMLGNATVSFSGYWDPADGGHTGLVTKLRAGTAISFTGIFSGTKGSGSAIGVTGSFVLEKFSRKTAVKGIVKFDASGKVSGAVTDATNL